MSELHTKIDLFGIPRSDSGHRPSPPEHVLVYICALLNVNIDQFSPKSAHDCDSMNKLVGKWNELTFRYHFGRDTPKNLLFFGPQEVML